MYVEFFFVVLHYYSTLTRRDFLFELVLPFAISFAFGVFGLSDNHTEVISDSLSLLRVLLGFTMATLALFLTKNPHVSETKEYMTDRMLMGKKISLYKYIILSFAYLIISETLIQIIFFVYQLSPIRFVGQFLLIVKLLYIFIFFHILLATVRVITETYFVLIKQ